MQFRRLFSFATLVLLVHLTVALPAESMCMTHSPSDEAMPADMAMPMPMAPQNAPADQSPAQQRCCIEMNGCSRVGVASVSAPDISGWTQRERIPEARTRTVPFFATAPEPPPPKA